MKIIHCGDIHLDSKLESNLPQAKARERKKEIIMSFCRMVDYAVEIKAAAVIIAGDLFDTNRMLNTTRDMILDKIACAENVQFLYLAGNHDAGKAIAECDLPENFKLFKDSWTTYTVGNVDITGVELTVDNCRHIYGSLDLNPDKFNIVTMHGQIGTASDSETVNRNELGLKGIDYLALGHYHSFDQGALGKDGIWCYSGCLEGRGFDECGSKGFIELEIDADGSFSYSFKPFCSREISEVLCDITGMQNTGEILRKIDLATDGMAENAMVKVVLTGNVPLGARKDTEYYLKHLNERFWFAKLRDKTRIELKAEDYVNDISLKGEFIRKVLASDLPEETKNRVLECGLNALSGQEVL